MRRPAPMAWAFLLFRHCEPTGRTNARPMTGSAKQSTSPQKERMDCFVAALLAMTLRETSRRQRVLDQLDPVRGAVDDRLVVEIIGGVMQAGAIAVAAEDERARPRL